MLENKIAEMLGQLSEKLGVASAKIWEWSLLQVKVEIVQTALLVAVAVIVSTISFKAFKKYMEWKKEKKKEDRYFDAFEVDLVIMCVLFAVLALDIFTIITLCGLPKLLINPEYAAFQNIVEQLGSLK